MNERHFHWKFMAFDGGAPPPAGTWGMVTVEVIGYLCEEDAKVAARDILRRDIFLLHAVWECSQCGFQERMADGVTHMAKHA
jgi:hypothetical protein